MSQVTFARPDGKDCSGFYVEPTAGTQAPGIVVIQEWWGLNDQIKGVAERFAARGYRALVPDLYRGQIGLDAKEAEHLMTGLNFADAAGQDVRGAVQVPESVEPKVGVTGFCMGGALTLLSAVFVPRGGCRGGVVRLSAARLHRRVEDHGAADGPLRHPRRVLPHPAG